MLRWLHSLLLWAFITLSSFLLFPIAVVIWAITQHVRDLIERELVAAAKPGAASGAGA
jgi:hypothetical protein